MGLDVGKEDLDMSSRLNLIDGQDATAAVSKCMQLHRVRMVGTVAHLRKTLHCYHTCLNNSAAE